MGISMTACSCWRVHCPSNASQSSALQGLRSDQGNTHSKLFLNMLSMPLSTNPSQLLSMPSETSGVGPT